MWCPASSWLRDLVQDGDVEANPGPTPASAAIPFARFVAEFLDDFRPAIPDVDLARQKIDLRRFLATQGENVDLLLRDVLDCLGPVPHGEDPLSALAFYSLYAQASLSRSPDGSWSFVPVPSSVDRELESLRLQLAALQRPPEPSPPVPSADTLRLLTLNNLRVFDSLPGRPVWMRDATALLTHALSEGEDPASTLLRMWELILRVHFQYQSAYHGSTPGPASSSSSFRRQFTPPVSFTLDQAIQDGGKLAVQQTCKGSVTFLDYRNARFYLAKSGRLLDISKPPPAPCDACSGSHWHWDCPVSNPRPPGPT